MERYDNNVTQGATAAPLQQGCVSPESEGIISADSLLCVLQLRQIESQVQRMAQAAAQAEADSKGS